MTRDETIEKIKKLLRLARSSNRHEADLALQRALELARAHGVAIDGLDADADPRRTTHRETDVTARLSYDRRYACTLINRFFRIEPIYIHCLRTGRHGWPERGIKVAFVGTETDCEIALYVYAFLLHRFAWCWRHERGRARNRDAFAHGVFIGIYTKLEEIEPKRQAHQVKGTEIEISNRAYIAQHIGQTSPSGMGLPDPKAQAAYNAGFMAGRKTEIRSAIEGTAAETLALT